MNRLTHLNSLQAIEAAMRCGSLKTAAEELGVTPAAVGQRIRALEDYLGTPLLLRNSTGMRPTAVLRSAMEDLEAGFGRLSAVAEQLRMPYSNRVVISAGTDCHRPMLATPSFDLCTLSTFLRLIRAISMHVRRTNPAG